MYMCKNKRKENPAGSTMRNLLRIHVFWHRPHAHLQFLLGGFFSVVCFNSPEHVSPGPVLLSAHTHHRSFNTLKYPDELQLPSE